MIYSVGTLQQFYNKNFKKDNMPAFEHLNKDQIQALANSSSFTAYKTDKARDEYSNGGYSLYKPLNGA